MSDEKNKCDKITENRLNMIISSDEVVIEMKMGNMACN